MHSPHFRSFRSRLIALLLCAITPLVGLTFYNAAERRAQREAQVREEALHLIERTSGECQRLLDGSRDLLIVMAQTPEVRRMDSLACAALFQRILPLNPQYLNFGLTDASGVLRSSALPAPPHMFLGDRGYIKRALATKAFAIGEYQIGRITRRPSVNVAYPVENANHEIVGVVFASLDLKFLSRLASRLDLPPGADFVIADRKGTVIVEYPVGRATLGRPFRDLPQGKAVLQRRSGVVTVPDASGDLRLYVFAPLMEASAGFEATVCVGIPHSYAFAEVNHVRMRNATILLLVTVLTLVAAYVGADVFVLSRVRVLVKTARLIGAGDLTARTGMEGQQDELGHLARSFDHMVESLQDAQRRLLAAERERQRIYTEVIRAVTQGKFSLVEPGAIPDVGSLVFEVALEGPSECTLVRHRIKEVASETGMDHDNASALVQAAGEAMTNTVKHAENGVCRLYASEDRLIVRVTDSGPGIKAEDLAATILLPGFSTKVSLGMGYTLMLELTDHVWLSTGPTGTTVQLEKGIGRHSDIEPGLAAAMERF